jgi:L-malate glycosyltransferase
MHVLFIPKWYPWERDPQLGDFIRKQAIAVSQYAKVSVLHVALDPELDRPQAFEISEKEGLWELRCRYRGSDTTIPQLRRVLNFMEYRRTVARALRHLIAERGLPYLSHVHILVRPALIAMDLKRRYGIPYIISEQSSEYLDGTFARKGPAFKALNRRIFSQASAVTAVSEFLGNALVDHGLTPTYDVVPNVVPGLDMVLPEAGDPRHFMVVADLVDKTKNVSGVIKAFSIARRKDDRLRLTVIGDGPDRQMLEELAGSTGANGCIRFLGRLPNSEVLRHMAGTGNVIVNSNVETFSVVTGEALALGRPVIATRCGGPMAFITESNGILIDRGDTEALGQAMLQMAAEGHRRAPLEIRGTVNTRFSYEAVGVEFMKIYKRVLAHAGRD